jgi:hypothetical protein
MQRANLMTPHAVIGEEAGPQQCDRLVWLALVIDEYGAENRFDSGHGRSHLGVGSDERGGV